jgi:3',5'-cyclic AMP phosphodiesterase CpdA
MDTRKPLTPEFDAGGTSRRGLLKCLAWAGTGIVWTVAGGVPKGFDLGLGGEALAAEAKGFTFVQISDSHIGFNKEANPDTNGTLKAALDKINQMPTKPAMLLHTGDLTHLSKPEEFDTADQIMKEAKYETHYVPGEHDVMGDDGKQFFARFAKEAKPGGWYSFDHGGVHFVALTNVLTFEKAKAGAFGEDQLKWLESDLKGRGSSTPIVVFTHVPMWSVYAPWGWTTEDAPQAMTYLKPFGSVTVLNGHIHQVVQKVEGNVSFRTAMSTAFPQPEGGTAPNPGPMKVAADKLKTVLGIRRIDIEPTKAPAITEVTLA